MTELLCVVRFLDSEGENGENASGRSDCYKRYDKTNVFIVFVPLFWSRVSVLVFNALGSRVATPYKEDCQCLFEFDFGLCDYVIRDEADRGSTLLAFYAFL